MSVGRYFNTHGTDSMRSMNAKYGHSANEVFKKKDKPLQKPRDSRMKRSMKAVMRGRERGND